MMKHLSIGFLLITVLQSCNSSMDNPQLAYTFVQQHGSKDWSGLKQFNISLWNPKRNPQEQVYHIEYYPSPSRKARRAFLSMTTGKPTITYTTLDSTSLHLRDLRPFLESKISHFIYKDTSQLFIRLDTGVILRKSCSKDSKKGYVPIDSCWSYKVVATH